MVNLIGLVSAAIAFGIVLPLFTQMKNKAFPIVATVINGVFLVMNFLIIMQKLGY